MTSLHSVISNYAFNEYLTGSTLMATGDKGELDKYFHVRAVRHLRHEKGA